jgi:hypothetical protein
MKVHPQRLDDMCAGLKTDVQYTSSYIGAQPPEKTCNLIIKSAKML